MVGFSCRGALLIDLRRNRGRSPGKELFGSRFQSLALGPRISGPERGKSRGWRKETLLGLSNVPEGRSVR